MDTHMKWPYRSRIVVRYGSGPWEELVRFTRQVFPHDIRAWTTDLSGEWQVEHCLPERKCISSRPVLIPPVKKRPVVKLDPAEIEALDCAGFQAYYKSP